MILNPIIPSEPMRGAVTKTSETCKTPVGWETEAEWALEQRAFQWNPNWSEDETRALINDLWRQYCFAAEPKAGVNGGTDATPAPEPQPEMAAEPVAWLVRSYGNNGRHIRDDVYLNKPIIGSTARTDFIPLGPLATPPIVKEAVKAETVTLHRIRPLGADWLGEWRFGKANLSDPASMGIEVQEQEFRAIARSATP